MESISSLVNCTIADCDANGNYRVRHNASVTIRDGLISAIEGKKPSRTVNTIDLGGRLVTPGLIDAHTHLIYGGDRSNEFAQRLRGASYEEISKAGGGITSTVSSTCNLDDDSLLETTKGRLLKMAGGGTTTIEVKSGYGLTYPDELRLLQLIKKLKEWSPITVTSTFLAAHALPAQYEGTTSHYVEEVINERLPELHRLGLFDKVDLFCDEIAFTLEDSLKIIDWCKGRGVNFSVHGEQLTHTGIAREASLRGALSVDHLERATVDDIETISSTQTVSILLPGAYYFLRETVAPPVKAMIEAGCKIAIATDHNPGTSPLYSLPLAMNLAATLFRIPPNIALAAVTRWAAQALGYFDRGSIEVGKRADLAVWNLDHPDQLCYRIGSNDLEYIFSGGKRAL
ncbi:MAG: imidazolonepropionase [Actinomycetota bacterium]|nr:imidazolonepropionase [Actinomycetota bacterium]